MMEPICEAERKLGLTWINIATSGVKSHPGKMVDDNVALVLFDKPRTNQTIVALWDISSGQAVTSEELDFGLGMLWDYDWRAIKVEEAFERLTAARNVFMAP